MKIKPATSHLSMSLPLQFRAGEAINISLVKLICTQNNLALLTAQVSIPLHLTAKDSCLKKFCNPSVTEYFYNIGLVLFCIGPFKTDV